MKTLKLFFLIGLFSLFTTSIYATATYPLDIPVSSGGSYYEFEVMNPTMVDSYWTIFNAMAALFQSQDYIGLIKLVFTMGGFFSFMIGVMKSIQGQASPNSSITGFLGYMLLGVSLMIAIFYKNTTMYITTNNIQTYCSSGSYLNDNQHSSDAHVANFPETLAFVFTFFNKIGIKTTEMATSAFSDPAIPNSIMSKIGTRFASYLEGISSLTSIKISDISVTGNSSDMYTLGSFFQSFLRDCIIQPAASDPTGTGGLVINSLQKTGDLQKSLINIMNEDKICVYTSPADDVGSCTIVAAGATGEGILLNNLAISKFYMTLGQTGTYQCGEAWTEIVTEINTKKSGYDIVCGHKLKNSLDNLTMYVLTGDAAMAANTPTSTVKDTIMQTALMNSYEESQKEMGLGSVLGFSQGKTKAEFVTSNLGTGYYMAQMLPYLQMGMRAVLYAFFPFVFIVVMLPGGLGVMASYLQTLLWIELWAPTAAILNMFLMNVSKSRLKDMYENTGYNPLNIQNVMSDSAMLASVGGYLYASVPALTWLILKGSGQMLGGITGAMAGKMSQNIDSVNEDAAQIEGAKAQNKALTAMGKDVMSLGEQQKQGMTQKAFGDVSSRLGTQQVLDSEGTQAYVRGGAHNTASAAYTNIGKSNVMKDKDWIKKTIAGGTADENEKLSRTKSRIAAYRAIHKKAKGKTDIEVASMLGKDSGTVKGTREEIEEDSKAFINAQLGYTTGGVTSKEDFQKEWNKRHQDDKIESVDSISEKNGLFSSTTKSGRSISAYKGEYIREGSDGTGGPVVSSRFNMNGTRNQALKESSTTKAYENTSRNSIVKSATNNVATSIGGDIGSSKEVSEGLRAQAEQATDEKTKKYFNDLAVKVDKGDQQALETGTAKLKSVGAYSKSKDNTTRDSIAINEDSKDIHSDNLATLKVSKTQADISSGSKTYDELISEDSMGSKGAKNNRARIQEMANEDAGHEVDLDSLDDSQKAGLATRLQADQQAQASAIKSTVTKTSTEGKVNAGINAGVASDEEVSKATSKLQSGSETFKMVSNRGNYGNDANAQKRFESTQRVLKDMAVKSGMISKGQSLNDLSDKQKAVLGESVNDVIGAQAKGFDTVSGADRVQKLLDNGKGIADVGTLKAYTESVNSNVADIYTVNGAHIEGGANTAAGIKLTNEGANMFRHLRNATEGMKGMAENMKSLMQKDAKMMNKVNSLQKKVDSRGGISDPKLNRELKDAKKELRQSRSGIKAFAKKAAMTSATVAETGASVATVAGATVVASAAVVASSVYSVKKNMDVIDNTENAGFSSFSGSHVKAKHSRGFDDNNERALTAQTTLNGRSFQMLQKKNDEGNVDTFLRVSNGKSMSDVKLDLNDNDIDGVPVLAPQSAVIDAADMINDNPNVTNKEIAEEFSDTFKHGTGLGGMLSKMGL